MQPAVPPMEELVAPSHWRTVDFFRPAPAGSEPATLAAWQHYLQTTPADAVFILGDLFEVWVGDDALDDPGSLRPRPAPCSAASRQRALFFMHGNRDFLVGPGFARHTGATLLPTPPCWSGKASAAAQPWRRAVPGRCGLPALSRAGAQRCLARALLAQPLAQRAPGTRHPRRERSAQAVRCGVCRRGRPCRHRLAAAARATP
jgi:UDP-2,3-diacylglucosamine hydrolase